MILREPQPDDEHTTVGGIPVVIPPKPELTGVIESRDPDEWKFVEALLPDRIVPEPPKHAVYPTPSGWLPPKEHVDTPYRVRRTRFHNFPVYLVVLNGGNRPFTTISKVEGDIWALDADVRQFVSEHTGKTTYTRVDEVCSKLWVRGRHLEILSQFLISRGF
jgi:large subunit ribosomal protein L49